jgi:hypothetical protein
MTVNIAGLMNDLMVLYVEDGHHELSFSGYEEEALVGLYFITVNQSNIKDWRYLNAFQKIKDAVIKEAAFRWMKEKQNGPN